MNKNKIRSYWAALVFITALLGLGVGCDSTKPFQGKAKILIAPAPFSLSMTEARFLFLTDYLSEQTGWKIEAVAAPSTLDEFLKIIKTEKLAFSFQNPYFYVFLAERHGAVPIIKTVSLDGQAEFRGLIICQGKSPIKSPGDLIGKKILVSNRQSLGGFLAQFMLLKDSGLDPEKDLIYQFGDTQELILEKVASGKAEVGFIREDVLQAMVRAKGSMTEVKVIASTPYHPTHCLVKYPKTDPVLVEKVKTALLKLNPDNPAHRFILERLRILRFALTSPDDYLTFHKLLILHGLFTPTPDPSSKLKEQGITK
jgi:phosphonate transport system substrate-binding protein